MPRLNVRFALVIACVLAGSAAQARDVQVMVLGTYHLASPGQDLHNVEVDDVTAPARQKELEAIADALAAFAPDRIAVEAVSARDDLTLAAYDEFEPAVLDNVPNEREQIGYRLAHRLGHEQVYGIDEQDDNVDYFPFGAVDEYARANGLARDLESFHRRASALVEAMGRMHATNSIGQVLYWTNRPSLIERNHRDLYYGLMRYGDAHEQPGALLNARYYERNARIFTRLVHVVEPGERVLVVYGGGHSYWLRHFISETPGFELVEPNDYLSALAGQAGSEE